MLRPAPFSSLHGSNRPFPRVAVTAGLILTTASCARAPAIFGTYGLAADRIAVLGWVFTIVGCAVLAVVSVLLVMALTRRRKRIAESDESTLEYSGSDHAVRWILIGGIAIPAVILFFTFLVTLVIQAEVSSPPRKAVATIEVTGHRWWWEAKYVEADSSETAITANEIHVPVGEPVRLVLLSADVIHSFWVPRLAGKTDVIPGSRNTMWIQADKPGVYWGECAEYCGLQHSHMNFTVVAESPEAFRSWLAIQRQPAAVATDTATDTLIARGLDTFRRSGCAACHSIRGTDAQGRIGPDLTHLASRNLIAAGTLTNTRGNLAGWISNAQALKPGSGMPAMKLSSQDLKTLLAYLETLK